MYRAGEYDRELAKQLQDPEAAKVFLLDLMEDIDGEKLTLVEALKHTIRRMGVKEFSEMSGIHEKSVSRMINGDSVPMVDTLDRYLKPFGLKTKLTVEDIEAA